MKKLLTIAALVLGLFLAVGTAQAVTVDLGTDDMNERWQAEYLGSAVSRNGVPYEKIAIYIAVTDEGRKFWNLNSNVYGLGLMRIVDCAGKRFSTIQEAHYDINGKVIYMGPTYTEWNWHEIDQTRTTMMGRVVKAFCGQRT